MANTLSAREQKFIELIFEGKLSKTECFKQAGYNHKNDNVAAVGATRLLKNDKIANKLAEMRAKIEDEAIMSKKELAKFITTAIRLNPPKIMLGGVEELLKYGQYVDKIEFDITNNKKTGKKDVAIKKVWFVSKAKNEEMLGRLHGAFKDKMEHSGKIETTLSMKDFKNAKNKYKEGMGEKNKYDKK